jgi:NADH-ubiquinone oxidoreductase chain 4
MFQTFLINNFYYQFIILFIVDTNFLNFTYTIGIDGVSLLFVFLSCFLIFISFIFVWPIYKIKNFNLLLNVLLVCLILSFVTLDLLFFYIFFESVLIPMFLLIGLYGSRERKIRAAYLLIFYTLFGSLFFLLGVLYLYYVVGATSFEFLEFTNLSHCEQLILWIAFFLSFSFKIPLFPFHI